MTGGWVPDGSRTRLILVRHGSTAHSAGRRFSGRNELVLDGIGEVQAGALARRAPSFGEVAAIVSSPLARTVQTADAIAARLGLPVTTIDDLAECDFGEWEGSTFAEVRAAHPEALATWAAGTPDVAPPGGESFAAVSARVARARDAVLDARAGSIVVVVSHVTPIKLLVQLALEAPASAVFRMFLDTASVSIIDYAADGSASVRLLNDTGHLADL